MDRRQADKPRRVAVGKTRATCPRCGCDDFIPSRRRGSGRADTLFCASCGAEHYYTALIRQIAGKVIERSDVLLKEAENLRAKLDELLRDDPSA